MLRDQLSGIPTEVLGLRARLSQAWLAPGLLCIIVFIVKLQLLKQFLAVTFKLTNEVVVAECKNLKALAERALQVPEEAVKVANQLIDASINSGIRGLMEALQLIVEAVEALILFTLDVAVGSYACLTVSAVNIAANEAINATESVIGVANRTAESIGKDINKGLDKLSEFINGAVGLIDSVEDFITGGSADLKSVNLTVSRLDHLNISSNINTKLENLRKDVPTYNDTKMAVERVISEPFKLLESRMNSTNITFHPSPIASHSAANVQGCNAANVSTELAKLENYVFTVIDVLCGLCAIAALGVVILELWRVKSKYRRFERIALTKNPFSDKQDSRGVVVDNMQLITTAETPFLERKLLGGASQRSRWLLRYVLATPLISVLCLGLAGIIISLLELVVLSLLKKGSRELEQLASHTAKDLTEQIQRALATWRNDTNANIGHTESQINGQILGWVHQGSQSVNSSISVFMTSVNKDIAKVFNGTMFLEPLQAVVQCLIGSKVTAVEKGLTWVHDHSQISLPRVPGELFSQNSTHAVATKAKSESVQVFKSAMSVIHHQIVVQSIVSALLIALWAVFAICAYFYIFHWAESTSGSLPSSPTQQEKTAAPSLQRPRGPPPAIQVSPAKIQTSVKSPIELVFDRVGQVFAGPARKAHISGVPHQASVHFADSPKTPLTAARF